MIEAIILKLVLSSLCGSSTQSKNAPYILHAGKNYCLKAWNVNGKAVHRPVREFLHFLYQVALHEPGFIDTVRQ